MPDALDEIIEACDKIEASTSDWIFAHILGRYPDEVMSAMAEAKLSAQKLRGIIERRGDELRERQRD